MAKKKLSKKALRTFRALLEEERDELVAQVEDLDAEADISRWRDGGFDDDPADTGSAIVERERAQSLSNHARRLLAEIEAAFKRMEDGSYGLCERCGEPVGKARLEAIPYATFCLDCKRLDEHGR